MRRNRTYHMDADLYWDIRHATDCLQQEVIRLQELRKRATESESVAVAEQLDRAVCEAGNAFSRLAKMVHNTLTETAR